MSGESRVHEVCREGLEHLLPGLPGGCHTVGSSVEDSLIEFLEGTAQETDRRQYEQRQLFILPPIRFKAHKFHVGVLNQVMECIEQHRVDKQKQRIVLNSSLPYARRVDKINAEW